MRENPTDRCEACEVCELLTLLEATGRESRDRSTEVDARVRYRRHMREAHRREVPLPL
ncbi:hypothetical protein OEIGOIKO_02775 [Streptomyces chrestomyceticus JCM 4735]|uniref:Uncharacterized protein n=1 Tax=Streptomyces chrestomyceticus JCM 4735 TaxID=1306181 RepID=A0A7U9PW82_9ACTN|nr:hypothetical protein OEIGOIKO_02775 [Streptomyces chrestomyceticus JCM 4735]